MVTVRTINVRKSKVVSGNSYYCKYLYGGTSLYLVYLPMCISYQLVHICLPPGIEPGNLIRSTLIRPPPGAFFSL